MGPTVELVDVTKTFGKVTAVDGLSVEVHQGEFFSLLGPSGCGKTTTLRLIAGFETPTHGTIRIKGEDVTQRRPYQRNVNTVFQNYALFPHLTVAENISFGLERRKLPRSDIRSRVGEALDLVRLDGMASRLPRELSGGQQQRVALARALVLRPDVLLLDEPLGALDLRLRRQMQTELKHLQQRVGITFIYVTHDQEEALAMSDQIAVMGKGRFIQTGTPEHIYSHPKARFVAEFMGSTNLFRAAVKEKKGECWLAETSGGLTVSLPNAAGRPAGEVLTFSIRPEKMALSQDGGMDGWENRFPGRIDSRTFLGASTVYGVSLAGGKTVTVEARSGGLLERPSVYSPGDEIEIAWHPDDCVVLAD